MSSKYTKGELIVSLDELAKQELIYFNGKVYHRGWFMGWQLGYTNHQLEYGGLYKVTKLKN